MTDNYSYKAFGIELAAGSGTVNPHRYVGKYGYWNDRQNVNYVRHHIAFAIEGRSQTRLTAGLAQSPYSICHNNPIAYIYGTGRSAVLLLEVSQINTHKRGSVVSGPTIGFPYMTPSCKGSPNLGRQLNSCCQGYMDMYRGIVGNQDKMGDLMHCIASEMGVLGSSRETVIEALDWLNRVCSGAAGEICVWCLGDKSTPNPEGWKDCKNECSGDIGGFSPFPHCPDKCGIWPIHADQDNCPRTKSETKCKDLVFKPNSPKSSIGDTCIPIALCNKYLPGQSKGTNQSLTCGIYLHELVHAGGIGHTGGEELHGYRDVIDALGCCLCKATAQTESDCNALCKVKA